MPSCSLLSDLPPYPSQATGCVASKSRLSLTILLQRGGVSAKIGSDVRTSGVARALAGCARLFRRLVVGLLSPWTSELVREKGVVSNDLLPPPLRGCCGHLIRRRMAISHRGVRIF